MERIGVIGGVLALGILVAGVTYSCDASRKAYYEAMNQCTQRGGTWVPIQGDNKASCINPR